MGSGRYDPSAYADYTTSTASMPRAAVFKSTGMHADLDPKTIKVRESRDSADNPASTPIIVAVDVTGSMGYIAELIVKEKLGVLFQEVLDRKPVSDPHLMFMAVGDARTDSV